MNNEIISDKKNIPLVCYADEDFRDRIINFTLKQNIALSNLLRTALIEYITKRDPNYFNKPFEKIEKFDNIKRDKFIMFRTTEKNFNLLKRYIKKNGGNLSLVCHEIVEKFLNKGGILWKKLRNTDGYLY